MMRSRVRSAACLVFSLDVTDPDCARCCTTARCDCDGGDPAHPLRRSIAQPRAVHVVCVDDEPVLHNDGFRRSRSRTCSGRSTPRHRMLSKSTVALARVRGRSMRRRCRPAPGDPARASRRSSPRSSLPGSGISPMTWYRLIDRGSSGRVSEADRPRLRRRRALPPLADLPVTYRAYMGDEWFVRPRCSAVRPGRTRCRGWSSSRATCRTRRTLRPRVACRGAGDAG